MPAIEVWRYLLFVILFFASADYHTAQGTRIRYAWDEGVEAEDWANVAKREKLDAITTELRRLELGAHIIHSELQHIRRKEEILRDVNGEFVCFCVCACTKICTVICISMMCMQRRQIAW